MLNILTVMKKKNLFIWIYGILPVTTVTEIITHLHCFFFIDTEHLYTDIIQGIVGKYGKTFTMDIKVKQMGRKEPEAAKVVIGKSFLS